MNRNVGRFFFKSMPLDAGEYVSLYQVQRGLLRQRAEQLALERRALQERVRRLTRLLPRLAPQLDRLPQWLRLAPRADAPHVDGDDDDDDDDDDDGDYEVVDEAKIAVMNIVSC